MSKPHFEKTPSGLYRAAGDVSEGDILSFAKALVGRRFRRGKSLQNPNDVRDYLTLQLGILEKEVLLGLFLDNRHCLLAVEELAIGTIDNASVHPREVVKRALFHNAAALIIAHNHPSGLAEPSVADKRITERLSKALELIDIRILDHFLVGTEIVSFAERGLL